MNIKLMMAIIFITLALVFYTIGVFAERKSHILKKWHLVAFYLGLVCDTTGTATMSIIAKSNEYVMKGTSSYIHGVTGILAILLMIFHAVWATVVYRGKNKKKMEQFNKFSLTVWLIWLIPYMIGMFMGMA